MISNSRLQIEVCANGIASAIAAQQAEADRIELCEHLEVGGLTPDYHTINEAHLQLNLSIHVLIRPREGNFNYTADEFDQMKEQISHCRTTGVQGVVFGILNRDKTIDIDRCKKLIAQSKPKSCTFHRAFDEVKNPLDSLEELISLGFDRILTSGQKENCLDGSELIAQLVKQAAGRIAIMAGGGITEENIAEVVKRTHTNEFHFSAKKKLEDGSFVSDLNRIRKMKEIAEKTFYLKKL